jgi:hypothetical protein
MAALGVLASLQYFVATDGLAINKKTYIYSTSLVAPFYVSISVLVFTLFFLYTRNRNSMKNFIEKVRNESRSVFTTNLLINLNLELKLK